jgi:hypothetical protein
MLKSNTIAVLIAVIFPAVVCRGAEDGNLGFTDTPFLPNSPWRVHDRNRPQPPVVTPGTTCAQAPSDAVVLFDGKDLSQWEGKKGDLSAGVEDGSINILKTGDLLSKEKFGDCQLHIEWATPPSPDTKLHSWWGNSGIFFLGKYELQVTESRESIHKADGQAGAIYGQTPPLVNAARRPGEWQTYDVVFIAPRFDKDKLVAPAYFTVFWNGVLVQGHTACMGSTRYKTVPTYDCHDTVGPIKLQQHGSAVRFRNIWARRLPSEPTDKIRRD